MTFFPPLVALTSDLVDSKSVPDRGTSRLSCVSNLETLGSVLSDLHAEAMFSARAL